MPIRIVVDTSVFISALIGTTGASREVIRRCLTGQYVPLMGNALFCEYESVLNRSEIRKKVKLTEAEIQDLFAALMSVSEWIFIYYLWRPNLVDEADNHLVELAIAGNASTIVTNNIKDFLRTNLVFPDLTIINPQDLIRS
ncbi:MAG: putative toxin-antitoxin system toxin component, PIN family [Snowella sp.]|nr:putative toxin-antitoxin system toxin component, PIN family [Snowella sp.]